MKAKVKIWIEDDDNNLLFGCGKTQILESIAQTGSISKASDQLGMEYKKAWKHIQILQNNVNNQLVITKKGRANGGTTLTPIAQELIEKYKLFEKDINEYTQKRFTKIFMDDSLIGNMDEL